MIFGLLAGGVLRSTRAGPEKVRLLVTWAIGGIVLGLAVHLLGLCPIVKRIWTPSWTVFSAGWVTLFLAGVYYVIDLKGYRRGTYPFLVVGANSIAMYVLVHVATDYVTRSLRSTSGRSLQRVRCRLRARAARRLHAGDLLAHPALDVSQPGVRADLSDVGSRMTADHGLFTMNTMTRWARWLVKRSSCPSSIVFIVVAVAVKR